MIFLSSRNEQENRIAYQLSFWSDIENPRTRQDTYTGCFIHIGRLVSTAIESVQREVATEIVRRNSSNLFFDIKTLLSNRFEINIDIRCNQFSNPQICIQHNVDMGEFLFESPCRVEANIQSRSRWVARTILDYLLTIDQDEDERRFESIRPEIGELLLQPTYIGDATCLYSAQSRQLRCAVNPSGPCEGCRYYEKR